MPSNKEASKRYKILDECLRYKKWTIEQLVDRVSDKLDKSISKRMLQYDIQYMRSSRPEGFDAPIICEHGFYSYSNKEFSINTLPVSEDELNLLKQAVSALKNVKGLHLSEELDPVIQKLDSRIETNYGREMNIVEFQSPVETQGLEFLGDLYKTIYNKRVLKITYQSFKAKEPKEHLIHPYLLKEYNDRWFLFGYDENLKKVSNLALDRIQGIKVSNNPFIPNTFFNKEDYFKNVIGVSVPEGLAVEKIVLWFSSGRAPYVTTKRIHDSQKVLFSNSKGLKIQLELIPNPELISSILSFGKDVKVLRPESLVKRIEENLRECLGSYSK